MPLSEELCRQAASVVNFGKFLSSKGHNSYQIQGIKIAGEFCPFELKISPNILLKQLVSTTPLKLLNRIS
jgi:hypothetical protein